MTTGATNYFLLVYHLDTRELDVEKFGGNEDAAADAYTAREHEYRDEPTVEVVMVGADSIDTVRKTHSHYFATSVTSDLVADLERDLSEAIRVRAAA